MDTELIDLRDVDQRNLNPHTQYATNTIVLEIYLIQTANTYLTRFIHHSVLIPVHAHSHPKLYKGSGVSGDPSSHQTIVVFVQDINYSCSYGPILFKVLLLS